MQQHPWFKRKFDFSFKENIFPSLMERLAATPIILPTKIRGVPEQKLREKPGERWSILEQIGHLSDLEPLWQQRIEDILEGKETMAAADLENRKTHEADHNTKEPGVLLNEFADLRADTLNRFRELNEEQIFLSSLHPRLLQPMRIIDLALFTAEHDAHHLASITGLLMHYSK